MLVVFAPQILLYGLAVVLYGILQAHRRFTAPALAPVLSSVVVISAYLAFVPLSQGYGRLATLPRPAELMLSVGTTAGVAALVLTALVPALRLRLRLRPTLRFPAGVAPRIRGLAAVGLIALIAQDASVVAVMVLANGQEGQGALVLYNFGWQMFFVPYAVLAVPIATTAFPVLAAAEGARFDETAAASTRAVMLVSWLGAALLAGARCPPPGCSRTPGGCPPAGLDVRRVRAGADRLRPVHQPVPRAVRRRPDPGGRRGPGGRLAAGDRRGRGRGGAGAGLVGGARPGPG